MLFFLECIHTGPKAVIGIGHELPCSDQPVERLFDQVLTLFDVIKDFTAEDKVTAVDHVAGPCNVLDSGHDPIGFESYLMKAGRGCDTYKTADFTARLEVINKLGQRQVGESIGVIGEKNFVIAHELPDTSQALADIGVLACIDKSDPPIFDVLAQKFNFAATPRENEIVRDTLIIVKESLFDHIRAITEAENEIMMAIVRKVLHQVPKEGTITDHGHRFWHRLGNVPQTHPLSAAKKHNFHITHRHRRPFAGIFVS